VGHSNRSLDDFVGLLREHQIACLVDIRSIPRSRREPQFNTDTLPRDLSAAGIVYEHLAALGGRRGRDRAVAPDVNAFWTHASFHNYADYALSPAFRDGLADLMAEAGAQRCAIMCSEAVWWRCHRRIVADHLIAHGVTVVHIMSRGRSEPARLTGGAVVRPDRTVIYPAAAP
jgi:uncharacterized protein (DUF488 family)